jgi:bifunctional UDP-N-acetylglucosamine pyrophosphorylase/glucosamine-1-phosphate N-acetyltransferase
LKKGVNVTQDLAIIILAAGQGKRMKSNLPKVLHPLAGRPMIQHVLDTAATLNPSQVVVVVGHKADQVRAALGQKVAFAEQTHRLGTGHAVMQAQSILENNGCRQVLVLYGDMPLLRASTLQDLWARHQLGDSPLTMLVVTDDNPRGFGRVVRDEGGRVKAIVEEADCTPEQLAIRELNVGVYCFDAQWLWDHLPRLPLHAGKGDRGEYYLTDLVGMAVAEGIEISYLITNDSTQTVGINTPEHLAEAEAVLLEQQNQHAH